jgi:flagellar basal body rod protein FlgC
VADPQPTPFVQFSKELFDAVLLAPMPGVHKEIVLAIIRRTYGDFGKRAAPISLSLLVQMTGRNRGHLQRALTELRAAGVVRVVREAHFTEPQVLALAADYEAWGRYAPTRPVRAQATATTAEAEVYAPRQQACTQGSNRPVRTQATMEDKGKTRAEKEQEHPLTPHRGSLQLAQVEAVRGELVDDSASASAFDDFWRAYPNRQARPLAARRWALLDSVSRQRALEVAAVMRESVRRGYRDAALCPHAATFLNQARYDDWYEGNALVVPPGYGPQASPRQNRNRDLIARVMQEECCAASNTPRQIAP